MRKFTHSIRFKVTQITVAFTLVLTVILGSISFFFFQNYARKSVIQATEFNLQLVAGLVRQDIVNLNALSNWCTVDSSIIQFLTAQPLSARRSVDTYESVRAQYNLNRSSSYVQRLVITDRSNRILQVGSSRVNDIPITPYNLATLLCLDPGSETMWQTVTRDPYATTTLPSCLYSVRPVLSPATRTQIGTVVLTMSTSVVTDQLRSYQLTQGDELYFSIGDKSWRIEGTSFVPVQPGTLSEQEIPGMARAADTRVTDVKPAAASRFTAVTCPLGIGGITLTHCLPASTFASQQMLLILLLLGGCVLIQGLGVGIAVYLNRVIMRPVGKMRTRMEAVAGGNFSSDPDIEWDNELGDVGRGINKLSGDMASLLDRRLADEKAKQELEYKMLQNQINPHFIYNTLNSIKWMATIQNATGIAEMTTAFSRLLKSVSKSNEELITLREEFALLNDYCTIQQYRYGGSITLEIVEISDEGLCECLIPRFSLQPLAENAIFHGIEPKGGVGRIWLYIRQNSAGDVCINMEDDGVGMTQDTINAIFTAREEDEKQKFKQIGVRNVHRRIQYAFGEQYGITIHSKPGHYTRMEVLLPYLRAHNDGSDKEAVR